MDQIYFGFNVYTLFFVLGICLQLFSCIVPFVTEKIMIYNAENKDFSFIINKVIVRRSLLFIGTCFVGLVALFESDYVFFVAQCLLFFLLFPKDKQN